MKQKVTLILITCLLSASLVLAIGTVTFSWYQSRISTDREVEIPASGCIIVGFDENPSDIPDVLAPAVCRPNAVRDNLPFDVLKVYNPEDEEISHVETIAETYTHTDSITFYADPTDNSATGYDFVLSAQAYVKSTDGTTTNINTQREVNFNIVANVVYSDSTTETITITPEVAFKLKGSATIRLSITMWLALPDELCDPALISNKLYFQFGIKVDPSYE